jgi:hypothetical protein
LSEASFAFGRKWQLDKPRPRSGVAGNEADAAQDGESEGDRYPIREEYMVEVIVALHNADGRRYYLQI